MGSGHYEVEVVECDRIDVQIYFPIPTKGKHSLLVRKTVSFRRVIFDLSQGIRPEQSRKLCDYL